MNTSPALRKTSSAMIALFLFLVVSGGAAGQEGAVDRVLEACQPEIETFCSQVTPGDGRLLACFVAHEDKISGQCGWAIYEAMDELEAFIAAIGYVADSCWDDLVEHCAEVEVGEGRVASCLLEHEDEVAAECKQAIQDVELEVVEEAPSN